MSAGTFLAALKRELDLIREDYAAQDARMLAGTYGESPSLTVAFNSVKYRNSECAWTMNTNNVWDRWRL